jgi:hypothetical protein
MSFLPFSLYFTKNRSNSLPLGEAYYNTGDNMVKDLSSHVYAIFGIIWSV